jgi:hypothetical protein
MCCCCMTYDISTGCHQHSEAVSAPRISASTAEACSIRTPGCDAGRGEAAVGVQGRLRSTMDAAEDGVEATLTTVPLDAPSPGGGQLSAARRYTTHNFRVRLHPWQRMV